MKKESTPFLQKDAWESAYTMLARTVNESQIVGKPPLEKYFKPMKPEHKEREFDGTHKAFRVL